MKILAIGDFHGRFPNKIKRIAKKCDLILSTGDFGGNKELLRLIFKYYYEDWTEKVGKKKAKELLLKDYKSGKKIINELNKLKVPIYTIHGNWDFEDTKYKKHIAGLKLKKYSELIKNKKNIKFLNKKIINFNGLKLYAFGGSVTASIFLTKNSGLDKKRREKFRKEHERFKKQLFKKGNKDIDILLAHYPPYGYFDVIKFKGKNPLNGKHIGFKPYTQFIKKYQPKLFICGHMHEYQGMKKLGKTKIITTGSAQERKAITIEISNNKLKSLKFYK